MNTVLSHQELDLILKSIGMRIDWLSTETERYADMMANPFLAHFKEINSSFFQKLEVELACLQQLQKRLLIDSASLVPESLPVSS